MPALTGSVVLAGALEPQARDPAGGIEDRVVAFVVGAAGEQYRPKGRERILVCGIECSYSAGSRSTWLPSLFIPVRPGRLWTKEKQSEVGLCLRFAVSALDID